MRMTRTGVDGAVARKAIIIGAGPAGLTAALELLRHTDIQPVVLEATDEIGGISRTIRYKGNRMDIGGHRFFSKSDRVMQWWMELMPPADDSLNGNGASHGAAPVEISYQGKTRTIPTSSSAAGAARDVQTVTAVLETDTEETDPEGEEHVEAHGHTETVIPPPEDPDHIMLVRPRKSRIYYLRKFFDYPIKLSGSTVTNLGPVRMAKIGASYVTARLKPIKEEKSLEDFLINRFGRELYLTFFKSYTEKVWGTPCDQISAEWGAQRIKGLSLTTALKHFLKKLFSRKPKQAAGSTDIAQKDTDTSLIERFLYPKFGPGQLWEHVADKVVAAGGEIRMGRRVDRLVTQGDRVLAVETLDSNGERERFDGDYFLSTMPIKELVRALADGGA